MKRNIKTSTRKTKIVKLSDEAFEKLQQVAADECRSLAHQASWVICQYAARRTDKSTAA